MLKETVYIQKLHKSAKVPTHATQQSAGVDLSACLSENIILKPGERCAVPTGLSIELPKDFEAQIRPRSGLAFKYGVTVLNSPGTIDADYRGEIKILLINMSDTVFVIENEMRIAQMVIAQYQQVDFEIVSNLGVTQRGSGGFGSTGV